MSLVSFSKSQTQNCSLRKLSPISHPQPTKLPFIDVQFFLHSCCRIKQVLVSHSSATHPANSIAIRSNANRFSWRCFIQSLLFPAQGIVYASIQGFLPAIWTKRIHLVPLLKFPSCSAFHTTSILHSIISRFWFSAITFYIFREN